MPATTPAPIRSTQSRDLNFLAIAFPYLFLTLKLVTAPRTTPAEQVPAAHTPKVDSAANRGPMAQPNAPPPQNEAADLAAAFHPTIVAPLPPMLGLHGRSGSR